MSETDNDTSKPSVESKSYSTLSKPSFKKAPSVRAEFVPSHLPADQVGLIRVSLEHDHGNGANDLPNSDELIISTWAALVTKTGTFADALKALGA